MADYTFYVKVANSKFVLDSVSQATIALGHDITYRFDQSDSSNSGHPLVFSTTSDGTHNSGSAYTTGVTTNGTAGSSGAYVDIAVTSSTPASLYYYCSNHSGMGSAVITTGNTHVTTNNLGLLLPILANADDQWGSHINQSLRKIEDTFGANADVYTYNITGDTTAITGSATAGGTLAFSAGQHLEVYLNGVKLVGNLSSDNDYTVNASTNTITLASNAINGDVVNVVVFKTFQFADAVPATGGTFTGTVSHSGTLDVSGGTLTTSTSQKTAIVDGGKGNLAKADVGLGNVTNDAQVPASGGTFSGDVAVNGDLTVDTDTLKVDATGNKVGIGASSGLLGKLHIQEFGSVAGSVSSGADTLVLQNNGGHGGLSVVTNTTSTASLHLGSTANSSNGGLQYDNNATTLSVLSGGSVRATIDSSGNATLNSGNLVIGTAGKGIDFSAQTTSSASGATPSTGANEVLDHYEVGTFEPAIALSTPSNSTCTEKKGTYCRIGDFVSVHGRCRFTKNSGSGNLVSITGLPFTSLTLSGYQSAGSSASIGAGKSGHVERLRLDSGSDTIAYSFAPQSNSTSGASITASDMDTDFYVRFSLQYRCAG